MNKQKFYIILGGFPEAYNDPNFLNIISGISNNLKVQFTFNKKEIMYIGQAEDIEIRICFCWDPLRDNFYNFFGNQYKSEYPTHTIPLPSYELVKNITDANAVLFLGLCGSFKDKIGELFLPDNFYLGCFKDDKVNDKNWKDGTVIDSDDIENIKLNNKIHLNNYLSDKDSNEINVITTNLTVIPKHVKKEVVSLFYNKLKSKINIVEKESYFIVEHFKKYKIPIGVGICSSDGLADPNNMMHNGTHSFPLKEMNEKLPLAAKLMFEKLKKEGFCK